MAYELPQLPYPKDALEPYIDAQTMEIHHDKHHAAYVTNVNKAISGSSGQPLQRTALSRMKLSLFMCSVCKWHSLTFVRMEVNGIRLVSIRISAFFRVSGFGLRISARPVWLWLQPTELPPHPAADL